MELLYSARDDSEAQLLKLALKEVGVDAAIQADPDILAGWHGRPQVYVHKEDLEIASVVLDNFIAESASEMPTEPWICPSCGEEIDGGFDICWSCQAERPISDDINMDATD